MFSFYLLAVKLTTQHSIGVNLSCDLKSSLSRDVKYEAVKYVLCDT